MRTINVPSTGREVTFTFNEDEADGLTKYSYIRKDNKSGASSQRWVYCESEKDFLGILEYFAYEYNQFSYIPDNVNNANLDKPKCNANVGGVDGCICNDCLSFMSYAEINRPNGKYVCFNCR